MDEVTPNDTPRDDEARDQKIPDIPAPRGPLAALDELLHRPQAIFGRSRRGGASSLLNLAVAALVCIALYGAASGFFQGGAQILVAAFKAPLIILASLAMCAPSFYVLSSLEGVEVTPRWLAATLVGFAGMLGLLLIALMPVTWLFSVSSASLAFIAVMQLLVWIVAVHFGYKFLAVTLPRRGTNETCDARGAARPSKAWILLFFLVSLQVASQMRPVLWRAEGEALFAPRKMFFIEHFVRVAAGKDEVLEAEEGGE